MAGRAIPRTFPSDESSFFTNAGQFALALFCKYSVESSSSRVSEFRNSSLYIIFHFYLFIYFLTLLSSLRDPSSRTRD